ncbi:MAG: hypothetical protein C0467_20420 [Planctomycetaceae bacterium]|nr:hypothetical protein [Planctomycetaceae bacterium]
MRDEVPAKFAGRLAPSCQPKEIPMKTLMTAAMLAALTLTSVVRADDMGTVKPPKPIESAKPVVKKVTVEELGQMLETMGYSPRPATDKDGKVVGYWVELTRGSITIRVLLDVAPSGTVVWVAANMIQFNDKTPASVDILLGLFAEQNKLWPAYLVFYPKTKMLELAMPLYAQELTPATVRTGLESYLNNVMLVLETYKAVKAKELAPTADPLP